MQRRRNKTSSLAKQIDTIPVLNPPNVLECAGIEYHGISGASADCLQAVIRLIQGGEAPSKAKIITSGNTHCLLLTNFIGDEIAIKSGFSSGYGGRGPSCFSKVLSLLETYECDIEECEVDEALIERLDASALTTADLELLRLARPVRPRKWHDYISEHDIDRTDAGNHWGDFPNVIPYGVIDSRIADLALDFWKDSSAQLQKGYSRLEDIVRKRTGSIKHSHKLFAQAFLGEGAVLGWDNIDEGERTGRGNLFVATYLAYRNPRAHRELQSTVDQCLAEFLLLNHLYYLEREAVERLPSTPTQSSPAACW